MSMDRVPVSVGESVRFRKTVGESDVYLFAGITGDLSRNHVDESYMADTRFGHRIAHGVLVVGFMSTCSTLMIDKVTEVDDEAFAVSVGYNEIRFKRPVYIGDTIELSYTIAAVDEQRKRSVAHIEASNGAEVVATAQHELKWISRREN